MFQQFISGLSLYLRACVGFWFFLLGAASSVTIIALCSPQELSSVTFRYSIASLPAFAFFLAMALPLFLTAKTLRSLFSGAAVGLFFFGFIVYFGLDGEISGKLTEAWAAAGAIAAGGIAGFLASISQNQATLARKPKNAPPEVACLLFDSTTQTEIVALLPFAFSKAFPEWGFDIQEAGAIVDGIPVKAWAFPLRPGIQIELCPPQPVNGKGDNQDLSGEQDTTLGVLTSEKGIISLFVDTSKGLRASDLRDQLLSQLNNAKEGLGLSPLA